VRLDDWLTENDSTEVLPYVLSLLKGKGYKLFTVAQCLGKNPYLSQVAPKSRDASLPLTFEGVTNVSLYRQLGRVDALDFLFLVTMYGQSLMNVCAKELYFSSLMSFSTHSFLERYRSVLSFIVWPLFGVRSLISIGSTWLKLCDTFRQCKCDLPATYPPLKSRPLEKVHSFHLERG
jgi:hypothetical protein